LLTRSYATTPQSQKQSQTNPISPPATKELTNQAHMRHHVFAAKGYNTASGAAERPFNNMARSRLKISATILTSPGSWGALVPRLCRLNKNSGKTCLQNHWPHEKSTCNPDRHAEGNYRYVCPHGAQSDSEATERSGWKNSLNFSLFLVQVQTARAEPPSYIVSREE